MAENITFDAVVEQTVINVFDSEGNEFNIEPQEKVEIVLDGGGGGGGSYTLLTDSEYAEFKKDMQLKLIRELPIIVKPEIGEQEK